MIKWSRNSHVTHTKYIQMSSRPPPPRGAETPTSACCQAVICSRNPSFNFAAACAGMVTAFDLLFRSPQPKWQSEGGKRDLQNSPQTTLQVTVHMYEMCMCKLPSRHPSVRHIGTHTVHMYVGQPGQPGQHTESCSVSHQPHDLQGSRSLM